MIFGIGTDILSLERFRRVLAAGGEAFRRGTYTEAEREEIAARPDPAVTFATRFAGKEAVFKALRLEGDTRWPEIEILAEADGAPGVRLHGRAAAQAAAAGVTAVRLSLSYDGDYVCAFALAEA